MGSLTSGPSIPTSQIVQASAPVSTVSTSLSAQTTTDPAPSREAQASAQREQTLLSRNRSRLGTVVNGFTGFLSTRNASDRAARKTLLGE